VKLRFLALADQELLDAFTWYEHQQPGLGMAFVNQVDRTIRRIAHYPESCPDTGEGIRRALVSRFPYGLWYAVEQDELVVYAVAHLHRRPRYWAARLGPRAD
jgi:plasmid stabilization system protein ParE